MNTMTINEAFAILREVSNRLDYYGESFMPISSDLSDELNLLSTKLIVARNAIENWIKDNAENKNVNRTEH